MKAPELLFSGTMQPLKKRLEIMTAYDGRPQPPSYLSWVVRQWSS